MRKNICIYLGIFLLLVSFTSALILNIPTMGSDVFTFDSTYNGKAVVLEATYKEAEGADYAALICPGYSCDRQKWRPFSDLLVSNGLTVMSFDYSGQGASKGTIGFDNAKTDAIAAEIDDAIEIFHERSGIDYDHIILVGHSMGGRSILRLLYDYNDSSAVTTTHKKDICAVMLLSPEVNYHYNAQASLFAGTSDESQVPWKDYNESYSEGTDIYLFGSTADDIVSYKDVLAIFTRFGAHDVTEDGTRYSIQTNSTGSLISVGIVNGILHSYEMYSPKFAAMANSALERITGSSSVYTPELFYLVYISWFSGLFGLGLTLSGIINGEKWTPEDRVPVLLDARRFLIFKSIMWLPGIIAALIVCCICVCMPFGSPVMNIPYMNFIAGYGFVMLFAYRKGTFKGTEGKLPGLTLKVSCSVRSGLSCLAVCAGLCFVVWYVLRATMYRLIPLNFRLFWVVFSALLMTIGYYISGCEKDMLNAAAVSVKVKLIYNLIQYVPLLLLVFFYFAIKSYSGFIGQIQNMILMYVFCVPLGDYIKIKTGSRLTGALVTGFLFQTLMITSAALISMF